MSWKKLITSGSLAELNGLTTTANITLSNASIVGDTTSTPLLKVDTDQFAFVSSFDEDAGLSFANIGGDPYFAFTNFSQTPIIKLGVNNNSYTFVGAISASIFSGSFVGDGSGLTNLPGGGGGGGSDTDWYEGAGFITSSKDVQITGSLSITGSRLTSNPVSLSISSNTASLDCTDGNFYTLTLASSADTHLDITNPVGGQTINVKITQPATVGTISFSSNVKFAGGIAYSASAVANAVDIISLITFDSTDVFLTSIKDFS
jgi:hypothetical protein